MHAANGAERPVRVLVVEDDDAVRRFVRDALVDEGFDVVTANDGAHALRLVAAGRPDIIVLDLQLPIVSGPEAVNVWRTRRPHDRIPIVGISALREGARIARDLNFEGFLSKPFEVEELVAEVRAHSSARRE